MIRKIILKCLIHLLDYVGKSGRSLIFQSLFVSYNETRYDNYRKKYSISESFKFNGRFITFYGNGKILCGDDSYIGNYSTIESGDGCVVTIGKNCHISHNVRIYTSTNIANQPFNVVVKMKKKEDVIIEDYVWIGANVFISPGVRIGKNSVVGANSVVSKNIPANSIWAGAPIRQLSEKTTKL